MVKGLLGKAPLHLPQKHQPEKKPKVLDVKSLGPMAMLAGSDDESSGSGS